MFTLITRVDGTCNELVLGGKDLVPIVKTFREYRLRWFRHVLQKEKMKAVNDYKNERKKKEEREDRRSGCVRLRVI